MLTPSAPWQLAHIFSASRLPSAISSWEAYTGRSSLPPAGAGCAAAPRQCAASAALVANRNTERDCPFCFTDMSVPRSWINHCLSQERIAFPRRFSFNLRGALGRCCSKGGRMPPIKISSIKPILLRLNSSANVVISLSLALPIGADARGRLGNDLGLCCAPHDREHPHSL